LGEGFGRFDQRAGDFRDGWRRVWRCVHLFFRSGGTGQSKSAGSRVIDDGLKEVRGIGGVFSTRQGLFLHFLHRLHFLDVLALELVSSRDEVPQRSRIDHQLRLFQLEVGDGDISQGFVVLIQEANVFLDLIQNGLNGVRQLAEGIVLLDDCRELDEARHTKITVAFNAIESRDAHVLLQLPKSMFREFIPNSRS